MRFFDFLCSSLLPFAVLCATTAGGCSNDVPVPPNPMKQTALQVASKALDMSASNVVDGYKIRSKPVGAGVKFEFFANELVGGANVEEMESIAGGFPDYFTITVDRRSLEVTDSYMAGE